MSKWNVFSNHGHVLLFLSRSPDARLRDVAESVGITERAVQKIVRDMQDSGVIGVVRKGRRNSYTINTDAPLRHDLEAHCRVGALVDLIVNGRAGDPAPAAVSARSAEPAQKTPPRPEKAEPKSKPEPKPESKPEPRPKKERARKDESADGGEQGSLF